VRIRGLKALSRNSGGRRTTADSATENRCPELNVRDTSGSDREATKGIQASRNNGTVNRVDASTVDGRYRIPIQDNPLSIPTPLNELLLNVVVVGRDCGENESQNSQNTDQSQHRTSVGTVAFSQRICSNRGVIAFDHEVHDSHSSGALVTAENA